MVRDLEKIRYMKRVEAVTPAENVDGSSLEKSTGLLKMSGGGRLRKNRVCEGSGGGEAG